VEVAAYRIAEDQGARAANYAGNVEVGSVAGDEAADVAMDAFETEFGDVADHSGIGSGPNIGNRIGTVRERAQALDTGVQAQKDAGACHCGHGAVGDGDAARPAAIDADAARGGFDPGPNDRKAIEVEGHVVDGDVDRIRRGARNRQIASETVAA